MIVVLALVGSMARADARSPTADVLRDANVAATGGDWVRVDSLVEPLFAGELVPADLAEAHRLAGLAAFFQQRPTEAGSHFLAYLRLDLEGRLDPALYPPEVVGFFDDVRVRHAAELRARRPQPHRYFVLNLVPPFGQWQNDQHVKAYIVGGALLTFAIGNLATYLILRSWCTQVSGTGGSSVTCDDNQDHARSAAQLRGLNIAAGIGLVLTYAYGVYDGVRWYRRQGAVQPFVSIDGGGMVGISGSF